MKNLWKFTYKRTGYVHTKPLYLEYSIPLVENIYGPRFVGYSANHAFEIWLSDIIGKYPEELVPLSWMLIDDKFGKGTFCELLPVNDAITNFFEYFTWPIHVDTREPLNFLSLEVVDKFWFDDDKWIGGFIEEVLKWKPSPLQTFVDVGLLLNASGAQIEGIEEIWRK